MAENELNEPPASPSNPSAQEPSPVCDSWQGMVQGVLAVVMFVVTLGLVHYYAPTTAQSAPPSDPQNLALQKQVHELTAEVAQLQQEQSMPAVVLDRYRNSIGYIYGIYQVRFGNQRPMIRARVSGTGFLVGDGLLATNRHVAEPWFGDADAQKLISQGASASLESLVIFFPGSPTPVSLVEAGSSKTSDLALLRA